MTVGTSGLYPTNFISDVPSGAFVSPELGCSTFAPTYHSEIESELPSLQITLNEPDSNWPSLETLIQCTKRKSDCLIFTHHRKTSSIRIYFLEEGGDLNPGGFLIYAGLANQYHKPLGHPSIIQHWWCGVESNHRIAHRQTRFTVLPSPLRVYHTKKIGQSACFPS